MIMQTVEASTIVYFGRNAKHESILKDLIASAKSTYHILERRSMVSRSCLGFISLPPFNFGVLLASRPLGTVRVSLVAPAMSHY
jgi:hypothetical protein